MSTMIRFPARKVMVELLTVEGVRWASKMGTPELQRRFQKVFGRCMSGGFRRPNGKHVPFGVVHVPGYLPGDRKGRGYKKTR